MWQNWVDPISGESIKFGRDDVVFEKCGRRCYLIEGNLENLTSGRNCIVTISPDGQVKPHV